jgi:hypothetical protein
MTSKTTSESRAKRWITANVEFFDSMYENKSVLTEEFIEHAEKNIYFRNVHLFLKRVKNVIKMKNVNQIRKNLFICLRDLALQWYTFELFENIKNLLRYDNEIEFWEKKLLKRFKKSISVVMIFLMKKKYTVKNVKRRRKSEEYAEVILRAAKSTELISEINLIFLIYNEIDVIFQRNICMSKANTKLNNFLTDLDDRKNVWWQLVERKRENSYESSTNIQNQYSYEYIRYDSYQFEYQRYKNDRISSLKYQYSESQRYDQTYDDAKKYQSQKYQSRDYFNQSNNSSKSIFIFISYFNSLSQNDINKNQRSSLNSEQNVNDYTFRSDLLRNTSLKNDSSIDQTRSNWSSRSIQFSSRSNEFDRRNDEYKSKIYNMNMREAEFDEKNSYEKKYQKNYQDSQKSDQKSNMSVNFVEFDDQKNELYYEEISVNSEEKYETFANFVKIEISCITCKKVFSSKNKLYKHLKNCKSAIKIEKIKKFVTLSQQNINEELITTKSMIVKSTVFISNKNYELIFRKWNYAEVLVKLCFDFTKEAFVCLNIDTEASLTDKNFVLKCLSKAHIHLMTTFLTMRDIDANVHETKKYVNFSIYFSSKNDSIKMIVNRERVNSFITRPNWPKKGNSVKYTTLHAIQLYKHHSLNSTVRRDLTTISLLRQDRLRASDTASLTEPRQDQSRLKATVAKSSRAKITESCLLINHK